MRGTAREVVEEEEEEEEEEEVEDDGEAERTRRHEARAAKRADLQKQPPAAMQTWRRSVRRYRSSCRVTSLARTLHHQHVHAAHRSPGTG